MEIPGYAISAMVGFATALLALPFQTLAANSKAMKTLTTVFNDTIDRLKADVKDLQKDFDDMKAEAEKLKALRCDRYSCKNRIPPKFEPVNQETE